MCFWIWNFCITSRLWTCSNLNNFEDVTDNSSVLQFSIFFSRSNSIGTGCQGIIRSRRGQINLDAGHTRRWTGWHGTNILCRAQILSVSPIFGSQDLWICPFVKTQEIAMRTLTPKLKTQKVHAENPKIQQSASQPSCSTGSSRWFFPPKVQVWMCWRPWPWYSRSRKLPARDKRDGIWWNIHCMHWRF